jgi:Glycosyltransferase family 87
VLCHRPGRGRRVARPGPVVGARHRPEGFGPCTSASSPSSLGLRAPPWRRPEPGRLVAGSHRIRDPAQDPHRRGRPAGRAAVLAAGRPWWVGPDQTGTDSHALVARALLSGHLSFTGDYSWLELVPTGTGAWYSPFPPMTTFLMLPFLALGQSIDTNLLAAVAGGLSVALMWMLLGRLGVERSAKAALTVAWAVGSEMLWIAGTGGQHLAPQAIAAAFLLGSMYLGVTRRLPFVAGLLLGCAAASRLPVGLALPLILWLYRHDRWWLVLAGVAGPAAVVGLYNLARFGSPLEFGYGLIEDSAGHRVIDEPWYANGIVSLSYLPRGLSSMLLSPLGPSWQGSSILLTMPILWWTFGARGRLAAVAWLAVVLVMLPDLIHGDPGVAQMGYRFILDALPILWLLVGLSLRRGVDRPALAAMIAGVGANAWLAGSAWTNSVH